MEILILWVIGYMFTFGVVSERQEIDNPSIGKFIWLFCCWPVILGAILGEKL